MWKEKVRMVRDFIVKNSKIAFPVIVVAVVAATVTIALNLSSSEEKQQIMSEASSTVESSSEQVMEPVSEEVPMLPNEDSKIYTLIATYYNAVALGDADTLNSICDEISDKDMLRYVETAKYIESYPTLEIYTKAGLEEGTAIAYVYYKVCFEDLEDEFPGYQAHYICTDEQGNYYLKRGENTEEVNEYIKKVSAQADVVEFNNRISVEYNELMVEKPELLEFLSQLDSQVSTAVGEGLAQQAAANEQANNAETTPEGEGGETQTPEQNTEPEVVYATANTTVNVRSSDSEKADKLGKVAGGTKIKVLEQRVNGWTKVLFEGEEGFIKSEFLQVAENASNVESVGTVTATTNINVRAAASETAAKLGVLIGGDSAELIATENGWCKIKYDGQIAYVKADYVE